MDRSFRWILLGAKSGIGRSVLRTSHSAGIPPLIGAADPMSLRIAERYRLPFRNMDLSDEDKILRQLQGVDLVLNAERTDLATLERLGRACLRQGCGLVDLSDQIPEHLALLRNAEMLETRGVSWIVSGGVASVTASLLSAHLHDLLPEATAMNLTTAGPDPRLSGIDLRWWRGGVPSSRGWRLRRGQLEEQSSSSMESTDSRLQAYPWRSDLINPELQRRGLDVDTWVRFPTHLRSMKLRKVLADFPVALGKVEHCVHRFGPPGLRRLTAIGNVRGGLGQEKNATLALKDALQVQSRIVIGLLGKFRAGGIPPGVHTPLAALGPELARLIGLSKA